MYKVLIIKHSSSIDCFLFGGVAYTGFDDDRIDRVGGWVFHGGEDILGKLRALLFSLKHDGEHPVDDQPGEYHNQGEEVQRAVGNREAVAGQQRPIEDEGEVGEREGDCCGDEGEDGASLFHEKYERNVPNKVDGDVDDGGIGHAVAGGGLLIEADANQAVCTFVDVVREIREFDTSESGNGYQGQEQKREDALEEAVHAVHHKDIQILPKKKNRVG